MKSYAAPIAVSAVVFITMLQPCPAPVITTLAIAGAGAALFGGGVGVGAWAASQGAASARTPTVVDGDTTYHVAPPDTYLTSRQDHLTPFEQCTYDGLHSAQSVEFPSNGSIIVADLPASCMTWFGHYNQHPGIDELNQVHGSVVAINGSAVELANLPPYVMTYVEGSVLNGTHDETVARARRSLGIPKAFSA